MTTMLPSRPLGQFFTPPEVVDLAFAVLAWLDPHVAHGQLADLSCGEGAFLAGALRHGFAAPNVVGLDLDARLLPAWRDTFPPGGPHLALADGLHGAATAQFDVIVGNPPFGGSVNPEAEPDLAAPYHWWRLSRRHRTAFPRELWFLERSLTLLKPGGLLAMVLPEGFLANRRWRPQREAMFAQAQVEAVIGLPRGVFRHAGTIVKTCLLFARHQPPAPKHVVRLAELDETELGDPAALLAAWDAQAVLAPPAPWRR